MVLLNNFIEYLSIMKNILFFTIILMVILTKPIFYI